MRGGVTLDEMWATSHEDRDAMSKVIKDNMETTKKTGRDFF
jgi:hypothetical protein